MKLRLLATLFATAALSGCATYDYAGGSAPGGYYYGRPSASYVGPYSDGYGYGGGISYGYGSNYGGYGYSRPYYGYGGGYYPYYPYRPHHPHPPRPPDTNNPDPPGRGDRPPPWRNPDGRYQETGKVMIPPRQRPTQISPSRPDQGNVERPQMSRPSRPMERPAPPRAIERPRQMEARSAPAPRASSNNERVRTVEP